MTSQSHSVVFASGASVEAGSRFPQRRRTDARAKFDGGAQTNERQTGRTDATEGQRPGEEESEQGKGQRVSRGKVNLFVDVGCLFREILCSKSSAEDGNNGFLGLLIGGGHRYGTKSTQVTMEQLLGL